jgi:RNA polymerase sigma factor (sigma-70 family)
MIVSAVSARESSATLNRIEAYAAGLYERHNAAVFRHCLKQLRRREDADDAVQTTFVYVLLSLRRGVVPQTELPWLFTIAGNVCSSRRRSGLRRGSLETPQDLDSLQDVIPTPERFSSVSADDFLSALRAMPDTQRKALLLREWKGLSYNEIAEELGLSQPATETLLFRARRTLARRLEDKAGVRTVNGASLASLIRSLLQAGAGKTLALAIGAAATIAAAPAAEPHIGHARAQAAVVSPRAVTSDAGFARPSLHVRPHISAKPRAATRVAGEAAGAANPLAVVTESGEPASTAPVNDAPNVGPPPSAAPAKNPPPLLVGVASTITTTASSASDALDVSSAPPVIGELPPLPDVQAPSVTVPTSAVALPTG